MPPATAQALAKGRAYRRAHVVFGKECVAAWRNDEELFDAHLLSDSSRALWRKRGNCRTKSSVYMEDEWTSPFMQTTPIRRTSLSLSFHAAVHAMCMFFALFIREIIVWIDDLIYGHLQVRTSLSSSLLLSLSLSRSLPIRFCLFVLFFVLLSVSRSLDLISRSVSMRVLTLIL